MTISNVVPPGGGGIRTPGGAGSCASFDNCGTAAVVHTTADISPGVARWRCALGAVLSLTITDLPSRMPVTTRRGRSNLGFSFNIAKSFLRETRAHVVDSPPRSARA
ncbi:hypothetical protein FQZ97_1209980 [compost metagenome]